MRTVKITNKKVTMRPVKGNKGKNEVWTTSSWGNPDIPQEYIIVNNTRYYLQSVSETR